MPVMSSAPALRPSKPRAAAVRALNPGPQHASMELKQRIFAALSKLADRDTQQIAMDELDQIVDTLSPESVPACLSCLYDTEMQQKSVVKKHCVKLIGSLASAHSDMITPHLSKVIGSILRRLRDPDSSVRDACVDTMGILSSRLISSSASSLASSLPSSSPLTLAAFCKPLLDVLSEQNKSVQTGGAMCLARVIESARDPSLGAMSNVCSRVCKFMSNPNFVAKPALLSVIGSLSQIGALGQGQLTMVMPCVLEALESSDWATRKASAETLAQMSIHSGHALSSFRQSTLNNLESYRFDKVKPVRDSVLDAMQLWKALPGSEVEDMTAAPTHESSDSKVAMEKKISQNPSPTASEKSLGPGDSPRNGKKVMKDIQCSRQSKLSSDNQTGVLKKKIPSITDKKVNHDFFKNLSASCSDTCSFEVAVPRKTPLQLVQTSSMDVNPINTEEVVAQIFKKKNFSDDQNEEACGMSRKSSNDNELQRDENWNDVATCQSLQRHLSKLEQEQSNLLQFVKDFITSSQDTMFALQGRVCLLEKMVADLTGSNHFDSAWKRNGHSAREMNGIMASNGDFMNPDARNLWFDRKLLSGHLNGVMCMAQKNASTAAGPASDDWKGFSFGRSRGRLESHSFSNGLPSQQRCNNGGCDPGRLGNEQFGAEKTAAKRSWDTNAQAGVERHGEGPSARSVWQASKDEATLAAIRVAGEEEASELDGFQNDKGSLGFERSFEASDVGDKDQWSPWSSTLEFVLSGDMESAYTEVLSMEDMMMLLRLMSQTGPVLDQLTSGTANELLHAVSQLLPQQEYIKICFGWIQQVVDMVTSDEMESIDISEDAKKELLLSLQETISTIMLADSPALRTNLEQFFQLLMDAWSLNN